MPPGNLRNAREVGDCARWEGDAKKGAVSGRCREAREGGRDGRSSQEVGK